jgi:3-isopropylmalate dehydrogenase
MATKNVVVLPGDGIGPEVTEEAIQVLESTGKQFDITFNFEQFLVGGASIDEYGVPIKDEVLTAAKAADAVFLGAVGGPKWDDVSKDKRPEVALLRLRKELGLFTNLRPVKVYRPLLSSSTLKPEVVSDIDILVVRELTGGIYFGEPRFTEQVNGESRAVDTMEYKESEITRIARVAFDAAKSRKQRVTSVDKANILSTSQLWRKTVTEVASGYSDISMDHMLVDNCAMQLVRNPRQFDVILTENMFGDILSDEAAMLTGSIGMLPSASTGEHTAMYEPVHGSAPDIAGEGVANPLASIASVAMMFRFSFGNEEAAQGIESALEAVLEAGFRTKDLHSGSEQLVSTSEMGSEIRKHINQN